jgi:hypothetical protein
MKKRVLCLVAVLAMAALWAGMAATEEKSIGAPLSEATETCLGCHESLHPGMVADWRRSLHARVSPAEALKRKKLERKVSAEKVPDRLAKTAVGCAECHTLSPEKHKDSFDHNDYKVHTVVTPEDCATCHAVEARQYGQNIMSHAYGNLTKNPVFQDLVNTSNGTCDFEKGKTSLSPPDVKTSADSCLYCHGTAVEVKGTKSRETDMGEMTFPVLSGWPNQGVGRLNPDGSLGSCAACHARHQFSMAMARKPYTCSECHKGPDVPAYKVYQVSKHGNIHSSLGKEWNFASVPWKVGADFTAPTCAACHVSLLVNAEGEVIVERTHRMNDRSPWRIFGVIYAHPHPKSPDTTVIRNKAGLPLPTELTGEPAADFLIDATEMAKRRKTMKKVCLACHSRQWVDGQWTRFENTLETTNRKTLTATKILLAAWEKGAARGLAQKDSIFNEAIEKKWVEQWLFFANSTRFASAMAGADYGAFANGRWYLNKNIQEMADWLDFKLGGKPKKR